MGLQHAAKLCDYVGRSATAQEYRNRASSVQKALTASEVRRKRVRRRGCSLTMRSSSPLFAVASSTAAVSFGIGFIGTFLTSPMLKMSTALFGEERSMLVFVPLFVIAAVFAMMLPETGPGREKKN